MPPSPVLEAGALCGVVRGVETDMPGIVACGLRTPKPDLECQTMSVKACVS